MFIVVFIGRFPGDGGDEGGRARKEGSDAVDLTSNM
jgi:hypothetical protein